MSLTTDPNDPGLKKIKPNEQQENCATCDGTGVIEGDPTAPVGSIRREDVPCPECQEI